MERDPAQNVALLAAAMFGNTRSFVQEGSQLVSQSVTEHDGRSFFFPS